MTKRAKWALNSHLRAVRRRCLAGNDQQLQAGRARTARASTPHLFFVLNRRSDASACVRSGAKREIRRVSWLNQRVPPSLLSRKMWGKKASKKTEEKKIRRQRAREREGREKTKKLHSSSPFLLRFGKKRVGGGTDSPFPRFRIQASRLRASLCCVVDTGKQRSIDRDASQRGDERRCSFRFFDRTRVNSKHQRNVPRLSALHAPRAAPRWQRHAPLSSGESSDAVERTKRAQEE